MKKEENKNKKTTKPYSDNSCSSCKCVNENRNSTINKSAEELGSTDLNVYDLSKEGTEVKTKVFNYLQIN